MFFALVAEERKSICDRRLRTCPQHNATHLSYGRLIEVHPRFMEGIHISKLGVIPKKHHAGKWRLIVDLSSPAGASVNDFIDPSLCSLTYEAEFVLRSGRGTLLAKLDIKSAYRNIPVHTGDRHPLGIRWRGRTLVDACLPFGLRSAPKIFNATADALEWIITHQGGSRIKFVIHYLDDFLFGGSPGTDSCAEALGSALRICKDLGFPIMSEKVVGATEKIDFLGFVLDTKALEIRYRKKSCGEYSARSMRGGTEEVAQSASCCR